MAELLLDTELNPEQREHLGILKASADSLLGIINDILDFSKIEAGKLDLELIDCDLRSMLEATAKALSLPARAKGLELMSEVAPDVPEIIVTDPTRLRQVVLNLMGNAIKFTDRGEVAVTVALESSFEDSLQLHFTVRDTGVGIAPEKQKSIFAAFSQADTSTTRKYGGTGLGLTICLRLVELMQGKLWVESGVGEGSTFHFTARVGLGKGRPPEIRENERKRLLGATVLIVDDNPTNRRILADTVRRWGMKPRLETNAEAGLCALRGACDLGSPFALVLSDVHMPEEDGFSFVTRIRQDPRLASQIVILLTSGRLPVDAARCQELGIASELSKPVARMELLAAIQRALGSPEPTKDPARTTTSPLHQASLHPVSLHPVSKDVRILLAEDNLVNKRVAVHMLKKNGYQVTVAWNGQEALVALERERFDLVLMDVQMPEMGGLEATAAIRKKEETTGGHVPIIAMTASAMQGDEDLCRQAGMDDYVSKPVQIRELIEKIDAQLALGLQPN